MKRLISALLTALMLFSLVACGSSAPSDDTQEPSEPVIGGEEVKEEVEFYEVNGVRYPAALGAPVLGEAAADLVNSVGYSEAAKHITNIGDAYHYIAAMDPFDQPYNMCKAFAGLLALDYDEVGLIFLSCYIETFGENTYCIIYIKSGDVYYPFDPFSMDTAWTLKEENDCISDTDFDALCERLMITHPYNPNREPMTSWWSEKLYSTTQYSEGEKEVITRITTPQYTEEEIEQWVAEGLTLDEWAEKISTLADVTQLLRAIKYKENADTAPSDNVVFRDERNGIYWGAIWNAHMVFEYRNGNCGGTSTIFNYLLAGDFDEQGYVEFGNNFGGHIFNYFIVDGHYIIADFVNPISGALENVADAADCIVYACESAQEFAEWYRSEGRYASAFEDPDGEMYLYNLFMYPCEGPKIPKGHDQSSERTSFDNVVWDILPEQYKDRYTILYEREGYPIRFAPIPDKSTWPAEIR